MGKKVFVRGRRLRHDTPGWVADGSRFFVTINAKRPGVEELCGNKELNEVASGLLDGARYYHEAGKWFVHLFLLMPDHLHAIFSFPRNEDMKETIRSWKRHQKKCLGVRWREGFHDHRIRDEESFDDKVEYIRMNPVRAGLCGKAEEWEWVTGFSGE
ncbi:MAG: hypothetical protein AAF591_19715 [Verrucomicrobiota bacterium]